MIQISRAASTAQRMLAGDRLAHSLAVGERTANYSQALTPREAELVAIAGFLHDIGYSTQCVDTGWHPLDGARWMQWNGWDLEICHLVVWHTCSWHEARLRGLDHLAVREFGPPTTNRVADALTAADLTTGPTGATVSLEQRLTDIRSRYQPGDIVLDALDQAESDMRSAVARAELHRPHSDSYTQS